MNLRRAQREGAGLHDCCGGIVALAEPPRMTQRNAIYANGFRFVRRRLQLAPEETLRFRVVVEQEATQEIRAIPICDVIMPS